MRIRKTIALCMIAALVAAFLAGCQQKTSKPEAPYFTKGVYLYTDEDKKDTDVKYYYVFVSETEGHTDDGISGLPFRCEQKDGTVRFYMGGPDPESQELLTIESVDNGTVKGQLDDGRNLVFTPMPEFDPDTFDAEDHQD